MLQTGSRHKATKRLLIRDCFLNLHESIKLHETAWLPLDIQDEILLGGVFRRAYWRMFENNFQLQVVL